MALNLRLEFSWVSLMHFISKLNNYELLDFWIVLVFENFIMIFL